MSKGNHKKKKDTRRKRNNSNKTNNLKKEKATDLSVKNKEKIIKHKNDKAQINKIIDFINIGIEQACFPLVCSCCLLFTLVGAIDPTSNIALFMSIFSMVIAFSFADFFLHKIDKKKIMVKIYLLIGSFCASIVLYVFCMFIKNSICDVPIITKSNVGNILSWLSLVIFSVDKTLIRNNHVLKS